MGAVKRLSTGLDTGIIDAILVTRNLFGNLFGAGPDTLVAAKEAVLGSAARTTERAHHDRFVTDLLPHLHGQERAT
ncbi:hypothetical protein [Spongiactinospora sp. 9N601]|uniref:hypothetical protein n=1 Tax=Spongiactinospora sp. 9N601 TaxID=3375149 RepID=UPI0037AAD809